MIKSAEEDLEICLFYASCRTLDEFYEKQDQIEKESYHKHKDVIDQIKHIEKLKSIYKTIKLNNIHKVKLTDKQIMEADMLYFNEPAIFAAFITYHREIFFSDAVTVDEALKNLKEMAERNGWL